MWQIHDITISWRQKPSLRTVAGSGWPSHHSDQALPRAAVQSRTSVYESYCLDVLCFWRLHGTVIIVAFHSQGVQVIKGDWQRQTSLGLWATPANYTQSWPLNPAACQHDHLLTLLCLDRSVKTFCTSSLLKFALHCEQIAKQLVEGSNVIKETNKQSSSSRPNIFRCNSVLWALACSTCWKRVWTERMKKNRSLSLCQSM